MIGINDEVPAGFLGFKHRSNPENSQMPCHGRKPRIGIRYPLFAGGFDRLGIQTVALPDGNSTARVLRLGAD